MKLKIAALVLAMTTLSQSSFAECQSDYYYYFIPSDLCEKSGPIHVPYPPEPEKGIHVPWPPEPTPTPVAIHVPSDAEVTLWNGQTLNTKNVAREFNTLISYDKPYTDGQVQISLVRDGETKTLKRTLRLYPGRKNVFDFFYDAPSGRIVLSRNNNLRLIAIFQVPADAEITVGDRVSKMAGEFRVFYTDWEAGRTIDDYPVKVSVTRDGRTSIWKTAGTIIAGKFYRFDIQFTEKGELVRVVR
jgi:hypothetical protein